MTRCLNLWAYIQTPRSLCLPSHPLCSRPPWCSSTPEITSPVLESHHKYIRLMCLDETQQVPLLTSVVQRSTPMCSIQLGMIRSSLSVSSYWFDDHAFLTICQTPSTRGHLSRNAYGPVPSSAPHLRHGDTLPTRIANTRRRRTDSKHKVTNQQYTNALARSIYVYGVCFSIGIEALMSLHPRGPVRLIR